MHRLDILFTRLTALRDARAVPRLDLPRLRSIQSTRLRRLVRHAYETVPLYRRRLDANGLRPEDISSTQDLGRLPLLTRQDLTERPLDEITSSSFRPGDCVTATTSGSSGQPVEIRYTRRDATRLNATWLRPLLAVGIRPWHARLEVTGPHNFPPRRAVREKLGLFRRHCVSVHAEPASWLRAARVNNAAYLWGYSGSLKLFAAHLLDSGEEAPSFRAIFGVSDLVDPDARKLVERAFGTPIHDLYGAAEAGCIAWECHICGGYHVNVDSVIVEILGEEHPCPLGTSGRVVVTNLHSLAMPIIRYELGDIAALSPPTPSCGRGLPLMTVLEGRANDFVHLPSGRVLSPMFFFSVMKPLDSIVRAWRVVHDRPEHLCVLVAGPRPPCDAALVESTVRNAVDERIAIDVEIVDEIPPEPSGKVRAVVSLVDNGL